MRNLCNVCGALATQGSRCDRHPRRSGVGANRALHGSREWTQLSRRVIEQHVAEHGWTCPGDGAEHPAHPSRDLTADHIQPVKLGGAPLDRANLRVLCRSRNSAGGAALTNAGRSAAW